jgi:uncharacterized peroxidase-related enzyme
MMEKMKMTRIAPVTKEQASATQIDLLNQIEKQLGMVPNFLKVLAQSPAALKAFLGLHTITTGGELDPLTRERIALAVAEQNACQYCVSAHTAIGRKAGLDIEEILVNRQGSSSDSKAAAALAFSKVLVEESGAVADVDLADIREAGYSEAEIVEIISHVAMNIFTNILAKAAQVEIDFPKIDLNQAA